MRRFLQQVHEFKVKQSADVGLEAAFPTPTPTLPDGSAFADIKKAIQARCLDPEGFD